MNEDTRGAGSERLILRKHRYALGVKDYGKTCADGVAVDVHKYKRQGEVVLAGYFNSRIGKAKQPG